jgi:hypothetical protein
MKLPRWNNARLQRPQGKTAVLRALHSGQGLEVKKRFSLPVEGEIFSLTFPFIDQAIALKTPVAGSTSDKGIFHQLSLYPSGRVNLARRNMTSGMHNGRRKKFADRVVLIGSALLVISVGTVLFLLADHYHIEPVWVLLLWVSVGFFAAVGWDYRSKFRSVPFLLFLVAWLLLHLLIFMVVMSNFGWLEWISALLVELFFFYATAHWLFGLHPPGR